MYLKCSRCSLCDRSIDAKLVSIQRIFFLLFILSFRKTELTLIRVFRGSLGGDPLVVRLGVRRVPTRVLDSTESPLVGVSVSGDERKRERNGREKGSDLELEVDVRGEG